MSVSIRGEFDVAELCRSPWLCHPRVPSRHSLSLRHCPLVSVCLLPGWKAQPPRLWQALKRDLQACSEPETVWLVSVLFGETVNLFYLGLWSWYEAVAGSVVLALNRTDL